MEITMATDVMFGERIRAERRRLKMTQAEFASAADVSPTSQVGYESDAHIPNLRYLARVAAAGTDYVFVMQGKPREQAAIDWIDWDTYIKIVEGIEEWLDQNLVTVTTEKKLRLAKMLLMLYASGSEIQPEIIRDHLKLVA